MIKNKHLSGFTIVELLVVIVVIGILAAITVVSYSGITKKANETAIISNLDNNSKKLELYKALNGSYPITIDDTTKCPEQPEVDTSNCLTAMGSNTIDYSTTDNGLTYTLTEVNSTAGITARVTNGTNPVLTDVWSDWYPGVAGTILAGKHVYKTDLGKFQYGNTAVSNVWVTDPQGVYDPNSGAPSPNRSLVADNSVDFSNYPARNACKGIQGRLPTPSELLAIYNKKTSYGNNFSADSYWSSTDFGSSPVPAYAVQLTSGVVGLFMKTALYNVRCVAD